MEYSAIAVARSELQDAIMLLREMVNDALGNDWEPLGGMSVTCDDTKFYCVQAMIRTSPNNAPEPLK